MKIVPVAITVVVMVAVVSLSCWLFGKTIGGWVAVGVLGAVWFGLKLYSDHQEKLLLQDLAHHSPEERDAFFEEARSKGLLGGKKDT